MSTEISVRPISILPGRSFFFFFPSFFRRMFDEWNFIFRFHANDSIGYNRIGKKKVGRLTSGILFSDLDLYI